MRIKKEFLGKLFFLIIFTVTGMGPPKPVTDVKGLSNACTAVLARLNMAKVDMCQEPTTHSHMTLNSVIGNSELQITRLP